MIKKKNKQPHDARYCGAKTRQGDFCRQVAGWGTDHVGYGRCKLHGGASPGPPKGNCNAWKHGFYSAEAIQERIRIRSVLRNARDLLDKL